MYLLLVCNVTVSYHDEYVLIWIQKIILVGSRSMCLLYKNSKPKIGKEKKYDA